MGRGFEGVFIKDERGQMEAESRTDSFACSAALKIKVSSPSTRI